MREVTETRPRVPIGERIELARYTVSTSERVLHAQRISGVVRVSDHPATGRCKWIGKVDGYDTFISMSKLLSVSLPDELSDSTDQLAAAQGRSRSEVVRDALRSYLWRERWAMATREARALAESEGIGPEDTEQLVDEVRTAG